MASLQIFGMLPVSHVLFTRRSISLCTLSGPGDLLFLSFLNCFSSSASVNSLIKLLSSVSVASFDLSNFSSPLSRSVFLPDLLTSAKTLFKCSAFLKFHSLNVEALGSLSSFLLISYSIRTKLLCHLV